MRRYILRLVCTISLITTALVPPGLAVSSSASADTVIDGCTIVSNPTPTHFTNCVGSDLAGADFSGLNLSYSNFAGSTFADCGFSDCGAVVLTDANLTDANLSGIVVWAGVTFDDPSIPRPAPPVGSASAGVDFTGANLSGADLTETGFGGANLTDANLTDANLSGAAMEDQVTSTGIVQVTVDESATLTGANFTGTIVMPSNQTVTATSQAGAMTTWSMPPAIPGTTPGACTPASGSTFPLFSSTVTCQVTDNFGGLATGTFQVNVAPTTQYFTRVLVPSDGAVVWGAPYFDAAAGDAPGVTNVVFEVSGGTLSDQVIATATQTLFGWVAKANTTSVPNGTYSLQSVATDTANDTDTSEPITITVNNQPPATAVLIPSGGASLSGALALLDASASSALGIASVTFEVSGNGLSNQVVATGTPTLYGYLAQWNTTAVPNGTYDLMSVATDTVAEATTSASVSVTVDNAPPTTAVLIPSTGTTQSGTAALLDASASAHVTAVTYELNGNGLPNQVIATGTPTLYGYLAQWNTTAVPNGTYTLQSVAAYAGGVTGTSPAITITVDN